MTRLWIAVSVLAAVLGWCFLCANAVTERMETVQSILSEAQEQVRQSDFADAKSSAEQAQSYWHDNQTLLGMVLRHDEADGVTANLAELCAFAETKDSDEFLAVCAATIRQLEHIRDMEYPLPENVL